LDAKTGDVITFDPEVFPPNNSMTITLAGGLPPLIHGSQTIDASNAGVILDGSGITIQEFTQGLFISSNSNTIRGLQIVGFSEMGIALGEGVEHNVIGGDRGTGAGPLGQGNLISGNLHGIGMWDGTSNNTIQGNYIGINLDGTETWGHARNGINSVGGSYNLITDNVIGGNAIGVYLCCVAEGHNTVTANFIGSDASGAVPLGNDAAGVLVDRSGNNVIGPGNLIAYNDREGIFFGDDTPFNKVTRNSIRDNGGQGIRLFAPSDARPAKPVIFEFDLQAGSMTGWACASCIVEVFSDSSDEGASYEGQTVADSRGVFTFSKDGGVAGPRLTANGTDADGSTTEFSLPTRGTSRILALHQEGNALAKLPIQTKPSRDLADNRIAISYAGAGLWSDLAHLDGIFDEVTSFGLKRVDTSLYELEDPIDWNASEVNFPPEFDRFVDDLAANDVALNYMLHFWDKAGHARGEELSTPRFKTEKQVQDFADYVRLVVRHFKGRIPYYTIWSEPDNCGGSQIKCIEPLDYINLARQLIPVIREEDPKAEVVSAPNVLYFDRDYLFTVLGSDVVRLFDVISWHPMYDAAPDIEFFGNYYYEYPSIIQEIQQTASANGFNGEYWGTEMTWYSKEMCDFSDCRTADQPWEIHDTDLQAAKYYARGIVMQLGLDVGVGLGGTNKDALWSYPTMRNLSTVMAGTRPASFAVDIESEATDIENYGFTLPNGDTLFAPWTDGAAVDDDPGVMATLTFPGLAASRVIVIDVLNGYEQELITETENGNLVIRNLLVKDYPIILRLIR